jgi:UDP-N-acetylglucosamine--N-acetylmuramyl-(pentapeptide) pyrophosphoryl-undecaprenol N-acetylglucosamine transferase
MFPAQALAEQLRTRGWRVALFTDARGLVHAESIPAERRVELHAGSIRPSRPLQSVVGAIRLAQGVMRARKDFARERPAVVVGFGGYPAFPALLAARQMKIPYVIQEQNAVLGRVNRVFAAHAAGIAAGFPHLARAPRGANVTFTGNPLREAVRAAAGARYEPPQADGPLRLLVLGGSLGAALLSERVPRAVASLPENLRMRLKVIQQTREEYLAEARAIYAAAGVDAVCAPFFRDVATVLKDAHLVIARAGASTVSELAAVGRPSILVPLRIAMDDHQTHNARALAEAGAADVLPEGKFSETRLAALIRERLADPADLARRAEAALNTGRPNAAEDLAALVVRTAG